MSPIERLKLLGALRAARVSLSDLSGLAKLKAVKEIREIRLKLGMGGAPVGDPPAPAGEPVAPADNGAQAHLDALAAITAGQHDSQGLEPLYARIKAAVEGLNAMGALGDEANIAAANAAITHWAELDLKLNG